MNTHFITIRETLKCFEKYCYLKEAMGNKPGISLTSSKRKRSKMVMVFCAAHDTPVSQGVLNSTPFVCSLPAVLFHVYLHSHGKLFIKRKTKSKPKANSKPLLLVITKWCHSLGSLICVSSTKALILPFLCLYGKRAETSFLAPETLNIFSKAQESCLSIELQYYNKTEHS